MDIRKEEVYFMGTQLHAEIQEALEEMGFTVEGKTKEDLQVYFAGRSAYLLKEISMHTWFLYILGIIGLVVGGIAGVVLLVNG